MCPWGATCKLEECSCLAERFCMAGAGVQMCIMVWQAALIVLCFCHAVPNLFNIIVCASALLSMRWEASCGFAVMKAP